MVTAARFSPTRTVKTKSSSSNSVVTAAGPRRGKVRAATFFFLQSFLFLHPWMTFNNTIFNVSKNRVLLYLETVVAMTIKN